MGEHQTHQKYGGKPVCRCGSCLTCKNRDRVARARNHKKAPRAKPEISDEALDAIALKQLESGWGLS